MCTIMYTVTILRTWEGKEAGNDSATHMYVCMYIHMIKYPFHDQLMSFHGDFPGNG